HVGVQVAKPLRLVSLRHAVKPPPQVLQTDERHDPVAPAFHFVGGTAKQRGPIAPVVLPTFLATPDPSATRSPSAPFPRVMVIGRTLPPPLSRRDEEGFSSCSTRPC